MTLICSRILLDRFIAQSVKLEELVSSLDLEKAKAETNANKKKIIILETKKNDLQALQEETSSLSERITGLKAEIANQEKKSLEDSSEIEAERRLKEMSQKYNFHYWGGYFYFCNGYLKYCPQSKVFRNGIQMSLLFVITKLYSFVDKTSIEYANKSYNKNVLNRPAWIFHLGNFVNTQNLIEHLVKLIARKLMPVPALKQQADVINRIWSQLERLIKSYHITMLSSKFPPNVSPSYLR